MLSRLRSKETEARPRLYIEIFIGMPALGHVIYLNLNVWVSAGTGLVAPNIDRKSASSYTQPASSRVSSLRATKDGDGEGVKKSWFELVAKAIWI